MRKALIALFLSAAFILPSLAQKSLTLNDINIRDPFIYTDTGSGTYYMYASSTVSKDGAQLGGVQVYKSRDLRNWDAPKQVLIVDKDNWITGTVWAPEMHVYNGKYYLFATMNTDLTWKGNKSGERFQWRGTQVFWSDSPEGPFHAFPSKEPMTPMDHMCLDGTLYVENGKPYMVFCHEWVECQDGEMCLLEMKDDLSAPQGNPFRLFCASAAPWSTGPDTYVTDGCFLYTTKTGKLLMVWSSFMNGEYAIGVAESTTGKIKGPWKQQQEPIFNKNGGHGMLFKTLDGKLCLVIHAPNSPSGKERAHIFQIEDTGETLRLISEMKF